MKKKSTSQSAFFNLRVLIAAVFCLIGVFVALLGMGAFSNLFAQTKGTKQPGVDARQDAPGTQTPNVVRLTGPVVMNTDLRDLPYVPGIGENDERRLTRFPFPMSGGPGESGSSAFPQSQSLLEKILTPTPNMPPPLLIFAGTDRVGSGCNCRPPDTNGDVGPNHYVQTVNTGFRVFDKLGNPLTPFTTYQSGFLALAHSINASVYRKPPTL
ncbi:MAG: hypothetical protein DMF37_06590 [Verrucomicrobia bacterium]|nr:MAG: hypothetical protein DMF37_06590 [Verrucomicrobiota bacterium]